MVPPHGKDSHNLPTPAKATKMMELKMRIVSITALIEKIQIYCNFAIGHHTPISSLHVSRSSCL